MTADFSLGDASRVIEVIDNRIKKFIRSSARVETTWGTVASVASDGKTAGAYLYGESDGAYISDGFKVPETSYVSIGDKVKVAIDYGTGERWIEEIHPPVATYKKIAIDQKNGQILTGDGTVPPAAFSGTPTGAVTAFAGSSAPSGWLLCDGTAVSRSTYASLFGLIGTTYGSGDGSSTFNLPNLKGRFPVGRDAAQTEFDVLAEVGGAKTHTHAGHSNHVFTQPSAHAAATHTAHTGGAVDAHTGTAVSAHAGTAVAAHGVHTHDTPFIDNGAQTLSTTQSVFGSSGTTRTRDWTGSFTSASGSYAPAQVSDTGAGSHTVTQPDAHTVTQPANHVFTQPSAHSDHPAASHTGGAVDAHSAHDTPSSMNPYIVMNYIIKA